MARRYRRSSSIMPVTNWYCCSGEASCSVLGTHVLVGWPEELKIGRPEEGNDITYHVSLEVIASFAIVPWPAPLPLRRPGDPRA